MIEIGFAFPESIEIFISKYVPHWLFQTSGYQECPYKERFCVVVSWVLRV